MVYQRKQYKKKQYRKRRNRRSNYIAKNPGIPTNMKVKLIYSENAISLNPSVGGLAAVHTFRCDSAFDPNSTGVGHQPMGWDQYTALYKNYKVIASRFQVTFFPTTGETVGAIVGVSRRRDGTTISNANQYIEYGATRYANLGVGENAAPKTVRLGYSAAKQHGQPWRSNEDIEAPVTASPTGSATYMHIFAQPVDTSDMSILYCNVRVEYLIQFTEPANTSQS